MNESEMRRRIRRVLSEPAALEDDRAFRADLGRLAGTGLRWAGIVGLAGLAVLVIVNAGLLGRPVHLWYPSSGTLEAFVVWDKAVGALLCIGAVWAGRSGARLPLLRALGAAITLGVAAASLAHDAFRGVLNTEYVILVYLLAVAAVRYRPWQAALLGAALTALLAGLGHYGLPGTAAAHPQMVAAGTFVRMGFATLLLTGVATLLYAVRYHQHRQRRTAERLHRQVADLERAKSRFFADVSHEFRTPLTLILGSVREALDGADVGPGSALYRRLERIEGQAGRMQRLVNELLELARLDEGRMQMAMRPADLGALAGRTAETFREWADAEDLAYEVDTPDAPLKVWVDPHRFESVLSNLISNAIKYTPVGESVHVRVHRSDGQAHVVVRDTGPGLPDAVRDRVFGRFSTDIPVADDDGTDASGDPSWVGMGIGLAHTKALVERHGGHLGVESDGGTAVTVRLPLGDDHVDESDRAEEADRPAETGRAGPSVESRAGNDLADRPSARRRQRATARPEGSSGAVGEGGEGASAGETAPSGETAPGGEAASNGASERREVVVIDDNADMRGYLETVLGGRYRVVTAGAAQAGIEAVREHVPDLVISDVAMADGSGTDVCRAIRKSEALRHLPVILLTAHRDDEARLRGLEAGADAYITKPFDPAELRARAETLIEIRRIVQARVRLPEWLEPKQASVADEDAELLEALNEAVTDHIGNSNFGVDWLADAVGMSPRHLRRRLKELTHLSPAGFIRTRRLQHAAQLLRQGADTIADVADAVGYRDASYFSRLFREAFGVSPSEYADMDDPPTTPHPEP